MLTRNDIVSQLEAATGYAEKVWREDGWTKCWELADARETRLESALEAFDRGDIEYAHERFLDAFKI